MKKAILTAALLTLGSMTFAVPNAGAEGSVYHERAVSIQARALWTTCLQAAIGQQCSYSHIEAYDDPFSSKGPDSVFKERDHWILFGQLLGVKTSGRVSFNPLSGIEGRESLFIEHHCGAICTNLPRLQGELPAQRCDLTTAPQTCVDTTIRVALDWRRTGDIDTVPGEVDHYSADPTERCLQHYLGLRSASATVAGEIDGLLAPLGELVGASLSTSGEVWVGTSANCLD